MIDRIIITEPASADEAAALAAELVSLLKERHLFVSTAESLTGGLISQLITSVPGASEVLECGVCSYSNRIKHEVLGVNEDTLKLYSEYSPQCALEMAQGVRSLAGADIGISTTGIAGPGGGTPEKPVGTVYVGIAAKNDKRTYLLNIDGSLGRSGIRMAAAAAALKLAITLEF